MGQQALSNPYVQCVQYVETRSGFYPVNLHVRHRSVTFDYEVKQRFASRCRLPYIMPFGAHAEEDP